ncbi:MAG: hypothetical protein MJZ26_09220 [Fibrobacter sp.]|nr:hypothetical protein [Fibrobacter sp.]
MKQALKLILPTAVTIIAVAFGFAFINAILGMKRLSEEIRMKSDTIAILQTRIDTMRHRAPEAREVADLPELRFIQVPSILLVNRETTRTDTILVEDSTQVAIPVEQKVYTDDSTYTAWISGAAVRMDSIETYQKTQTETKIITNTITRKKRIGFVISAGGAITPKGIQPGLTFGIGWMF